MAAFALAFALALSAPATALGATFTVTSLADEATGGTLREAIALANSEPDPDIIVFQDGLTGTISLASGELAVTDSLSIVGPGAGELTVAGDGARVFHVEHEHHLIDVTIAGLGVRDGSDDSGGCVLARGANLSLEGVTLTDCEASGDGGAVAFDGAYSAQTVSLIDCVVSGNTAGGSGGGVIVHSFNGDTLFENTTLEDNEAGAYGGGASVSFYNSDLDLRHCTISNNHALGGSGGGLSLSTYLGLGTIVASTISGNTSTLDGGGVSAFFHYQLDIVDSTFSGNSCEGKGGALDAIGEITIAGSTLSGNAAGGPGGALSSRYSIVHLQHATIAGNTTDEAGGSVAVVEAAVDIEHSILANSTASPEGELSLENDATIDVSFSLIEEPGTVSISGSGNILGEDPLLGPLEDNDGPTLTHLPAGDSPVIDAGNPELETPPILDQRGLPRVTGAVIDIGSVEGSSNGEPVAGGAGGVGGDTATAGAGDTDAGGAAGQPGSAGGAEIEGGSGGQREAPGAGGSAGAAEETDGSSPQESDGCDCEVPRSGARSNGAFGALLLLVGAALRRSRRLTVARAQR